MKLRSRNTSKPTNASQRSSSRNDRSRSAVRHPARNMSATLPLIITSVSSISSNQTIAGQFAEPRSVDFSANRQLATANHFPALPVRDFQTYQSTSDFELKRRSSNWLYRTTMSFSATLRAWRQRTVHQPTVRPPHCCCY